MKVLLIYDHVERERYRAHLTEIIQDAHADLLEPRFELLEVDKVEGSVRIEREFQKLASQADVVMIDVSKPNTDVGYEVGRFFRKGDRRLLLFSCSPEFPKDLPFYLKNVKCLELDQVIFGGPRAKDQKAKAVRAISVLGHRHQLEALGKPRRFLPTEAFQEKLRASCDRIYKAPGAAFLFGEHAVTTGHPALHLPLPRYVYVGIRRAHAGRPKLRFVRPGARTEDDADFLEERFLPDFAKTIDRLIQQHVEIWVWSELPTMCGLGTSSAIAACLALESMGLEEVPVIPECSDANWTGNLLAHPEFERLFKTGWKIDAAFHTFLGSGAGVFASLAGTSQFSPLYFFSEPRRTWTGDVGRFPRDLSAYDHNGLDLKRSWEHLDAVKCVGFRLGTGNSPFQTGHFAAVFSGYPKSTGLAVARDEAMGRYLQTRPAMIRAMVEAIDKAGIKPRYPLSQRLTDAYKLVVDEMDSGGTTESAERQHEGAIRETLYGIYGCASLAGINSYWSGDNRFLSLMESCEVTLESLGLARVSTNGVARAELVQLARSLNSVRTSDGVRLLGAKITGGGTGGDLIVCSREEDTQVFERLLRDAILDARTQVDDPAERLGEIHFSSTWVEGFPDAYKASPACLIKG